MNYFAKTSPISFKFYGSSHKSKNMSQQTRKMKNAIYIIFKKEGGENVSILTNVVDL